MIDIELNKNLDYETYTNFHDFKIAGVDFRAAIKRDHSSITPENYQQYIDDFYSINQTELNSAVSELQASVNTKQEAFFQALKSLFGIDFRSNRYVGYLSIFNCNPRFIDSNTFQVFYKKELDDKVEVVFHELMHFAFFEYCKNNLKDKTGGMNTNSGPLWELSEIFNVIVLNEPAFKNLLKREEKLFYPNLKEKLENIKEIWNSTHANLSDFIIDSLDYLIGK